MTHKLSAALLAVLLAAPAFAQGEAPSGDIPSDYRWAVYTACTLVFLAIIVYLVSSHRRMSRAAGDVEHLERRVNSLEGGS